MVEEPPAIKAPRKESVTVAAPDPIKNSSPAPPEPPKAETGAVDSGERTYVNPRTAWLYRWI